MARRSYRRTLESGRKGQGAAALGSVAMVEGRLDGQWAQPAAGVVAGRQPETGLCSQESGGQWG